jgi:hypothetical protein
VKSCHGVGWSSARLRGLVAIAVWRATMSTPSRPVKPSRTSPAFAVCSNSSQTDLRNTLLVNARYDRPSPRPAEPNARRRSDQYGFHRTTQCHLSGAFEWTGVLRASLTKQIDTLQRGVYLVGTVYNFCTFHHSLRVPLAVGSRGRVHWVQRTPAMVAGITDHRWTVRELMLYRVPPP